MPSNKKSKSKSNTRSGSTFKTKCRFCRVKCIGQNVCKNCRDTNHHYKLEILQDATEKGEINEGEYLKQCNHLKKEKELEELAKTIDTFDTPINTNDEQDVEMPLGMRIILENMINARRGEGAEPTVRERERRAMTTMIDTIGDTPFNFTNGRIIDYPFYTAVGMIIRVDLIMKALIYRAHSRRDAPQALTVEEVIQPIRDAWINNAYRIENNITEDIDRISLTLNIVNNTVQFNIHNSIFDGTIGENGRPNADAFPFYHFTWRVGGVIEQGRISMERVVRESSEEDEDYDYDWEITSDEDDESSEEEDESSEEDEDDVYDIEYDRGQLLIPRHSRR